MGDLNRRVRRIREAMGAMVENDMTKLPASVITTPHSISLTQDFAGGRSSESTENTAHTLIANVASLRDHLITWAEANGHTKDEVYDAMRNSEPLKIMADLWNKDKHGAPLRKPWMPSTVSLVNVRTRLRLSTGAEAGSAVTLRLGHGGVLKKSGKGSAEAVVHGDVVDEHGSRLGELSDIARCAIRDWERLLQGFGVRLT